MVNRAFYNKARVESRAICVRGVREYKLKKKQFLESSGIVSISDPTGILVTSAVVSGKCYLKDVTGVIQEHIGQVKCPMDAIHIDTGRLNEFTVHDIEPGTQKIIQIEYMTDDKTTKEEEVCCDEHACKCDDEHVHNHTNHGADRTCLDHIRPNCKKHRKRRIKKHHHQHHNHHATHSCVNASQHHHHHHSPRKNKMLLFPLFPIRGAYVYPLITPPHHHHHDHC